MNISFAVQSFAKFLFFYVLVVFLPYNINRNKVAYNINRNKTQ